MATGNEIWVKTGRALERLDLFNDTELLPTFCVNDRAKPDTIEASYNPDVSIPATSKNHRLLSYAAAAQPLLGQPYRYLKAMLTSGGVEIMPNALLTIRGYSAGQYKVALESGNIFFLDAIGDKKLSDLDLSAYNHFWTPAEILPKLSYDFWRANRFGYELYDRGKPLDIQAVDPYTLYPSVAASLVFNQILADAGFTSTDLTSEPLFAQLNVPSANPFTFPDEYRNDRSLKAGFEHTGNFYRDDEFQELAPFNFTARKPYGIGPLALAQGSTANRFVAPALGYYDLNVSLPVYFGCNPRASGEVSMKVVLRKNGAPLLNDDGTQVETGDRFSNYKNLTFTLSKKVPLQPGDVIDAQIQGDKWPGNFGGPSNAQWYVGTSVRRFPGQTFPPDFSGVEPGMSFSVQMLPDFPPGGLVKLNEWLPGDVSQLDYFKSIMLLLGLTVVADAYTPHLHLTPGNKPLHSTPLNWTNKRDAATVPGRTPERELSYQLGEYGQSSVLKWKEDENVEEGYGDGELTIEDETLPTEYEIATLPFAATEASPTLPGLLRILNFEAQDLSAKPVTYSSIQAQPRLTLRGKGPLLIGQLITTPADPLTSTAQLVVPFTTTASYFDSLDLSLELDKTVLTNYWADLRSLVDEARVLSEQIRLTAADLLEPDLYTRLVWLGGLEDYFLISKISEFDASRSTSVELVRVNSKYLPPPPVPGVGLREWYSAEWGGSGEWY